MSQRQGLQRATWIPTRKISGRWDRSRGLGFARSWAQQHSCPARRPTLGAAAVYLILLQRLLLFCVGSADRPPAMPSELSEAEALDIMQLLISTGLVLKDEATGKPGECAVHLPRVEMLRRPGAAAASL